MTRKLNEELYPPCAGYDPQTHKCVYSGGYFSEKEHRENQAHARWVAENKVQRASETEKLCPRCFLPMSALPGVNSRSLDNKQEICSLCGQIETMETTDPLHAYGLRLGQRQLQAVRYSLKNGEPRLPE